MMHKTGGNMTGAATVPVSSTKTLKDYIALKQESDSMFEKKKLTFEEWFSQSGWAAHFSAMGDEFAKQIMKFAWKASQENTPSQAPGAQQSLD